MENRKTGKLRTNYEKSKETEKKRKGNWRKCKEASSHAVFVEKEERQEEILRIFLLYEPRHIVISYTLEKPKQSVLAHVTRNEGPCHFTPGRTTPRIPAPTTALVTVTNTETYILAGN